MASSVNVLQGYCPIILSGCKVFGLIVKDYGHAIEIGGNVFLDSLLVLGGKCWLLENENKFSTSNTKSIMGVFAYV
jgi:hypothetical protein